MPSRVPSPTSIRRTIFCTVTLRAALISSLCLSLHTGFLIQTRSYLSDPNPPVTIAPPGQPQENMAGSTAILSRYQEAQTIAHKDRQRGIEMFNQIGLSLPFPVTLF